jgi:hypothetical protein
MALALQGQRPPRQTFRSSACDVTVHHERFGEQR